MGVRPIPPPLYLLRSPLTGPFPLCHDVTDLEGETTTPATTRPRTPTSAGGPNRVPHAALARPSAFAARNNSIVNAVLLMIGVVQGIESAGIGPNRATKVGVGVTASSRGDG